MMQKLKVMWTLMRWLFIENHPNGVRATINHHFDGRTWFLVEDHFIWIPADVTMQQAVVEIDGWRYVRIGGGEHAGKYIPIGSLADVLTEREQ